MDPDTNRPEPATSRPSRGSRKRLACRRCQSRKIKCDGGLPRCSACERASADCISGKSYSIGPGISKSAAIALRKENERLRQLVGSRGRETEDLDLSQEPASSEQHSQAAPNRSPPNDLDASTFIPARTQEPLLPLSAPSSQDGSTEGQCQHGDIAYELGMISVSAGVNKYIGPSSGFSIARLVFARAGQASSDRPGSRSTEDSTGDSRSRPFLLLNPSPLPTSEQETVQLSRVFFEQVHPRYPFLHEQTHFRRIAEVYRNPQAPKTSQFQVTMVLAISSIIMSRRLRKTFNGEGICATAMEYADQVDFQSSMEGVQCLMLIYLFTLHSPVLGFNPWYLNYQCLAAILDLGFQHDITSSRSVNLYEGEMRRRIFWVAYSIDRILASTLGRPIGFRDEACDLRMPEVLDDHLLEVLRTRDRIPEPSFDTESGSATCALVHFKLALFNSEIIYILHSKTAAPDYTYPRIPDMEAWKHGLYARLLAVRREYSHFQNNEQYLWQLCEIRYHEIVMLLFRPTPRIRAPPQDSLHQCSSSAEATITLWKSLADSNRISYSWPSVHSICLSAITMLYCIWMVRGLAVDVEIGHLTQIMMTASSLLSASGEYWTDANKCRDSLNNLTAATIRWLVGLRASTATATQPVDQDNRVQPAGHAAVHDTINDPDNTVSQEIPGLIEDRTFQSDPDFPWIDTYINSEDLTTLFRTSNFDDCDLTSTVEGMFSQYPPIFDLSHENAGRM